MCFAPTAAGPGIPEIKAYLNGVDTPNMYGASTLIVKVGHDSQRAFCCQWKMASMLELEGNLNSKYDHRFCGKSIISALGDIVEVLAR